MAFDNKWWHLLIWLLTIACGDKTKQLKEAAMITTVDTIVTVQKQSGPAVDTVVSQFKTYLNTLDDTQVNNVKAAYLNYRLIFQNRPSALCNSGYALFESFYNQVYNRANESSVLQMTNSKRKDEFKAALLSYGFELAQQEGEWYYKQNREFISKQFYTFVSPEMKDFLELMLKESKAPYASEGGLNIQPKELAERFVWWNRFCMTHPDFILKIYSENNATVYADILINGMENTPQFTGEQPMLNNYYKEAYDYMLKQYSTVSFVKKFAPYYQALLKNDEMEIAAFLARWLPYEIPNDAE
jgi:hypothetical protein